MEIRIQINCETIKEFDAHLHMLQVQIQDAVKKLKLETSDEFNSEAENDLYDDNCYGTHIVSIHNDGDTEKAQMNFLELVPTEEHGENPDAEFLWEFCFNRQGSTSFE